MTVTALRSSLYSMYSLKMMYKGDGAMEYRIRLPTEERDSLAVSVMGTAFEQSGAGDHDIRIPLRIEIYKKGLVKHMGMMLIVGGLIFLLFFMLAGYLVSSAAIVRVLKLFGYEKAVFGWMPFVRHYALGTVCIQQSGSLPCVFGSFALPNVFLQWGWAAVLLAYLIPTVGYVLGLGMSVLYYGSVYHFVYSRLFGEDSVVLAAVSSVVRIVFYIRVLICSHEGKELCSRHEDIYPRERTAQAGGRV